MKVTEVPQALNYILISDDGSYHSTESAVFVADAQQRNMRKQKLPKYLRDLDMIGANVCLQKLFDMKF